MQYLKRLFKKIRGIQKFYKELKFIQIVNEC